MTNVYTGDLYQPRRTNIHALPPSFTQNKISAQSLNGIDYILFNEMIFGGATLLSDMQISLLQVNNTDVGNKKSLCYFPVSGAVYPTISNITKGISLYYFCVAFQDFTTNNQSIRLSWRYPPMIYSSHNLINWSAGAFLNIPTGSSYGGFVPVTIAGVTTNNQLEVIAIGISTNMIAGLWPSSNTGYVNILKGSSKLDISADITDYTNTDNTTVNITLGNMK